VSCRRCKQGQAMTKNTDKHRPARTLPTDADAEGARPCASLPVRVSPNDLPAVLAANGALSLLCLCTHLVGRQMNARTGVYHQVHEHAYSIVDREFAIAMGLSTARWRRIRCLDPQRDRVPILLEAMRGGLIRVRGQCELQSQVEPGLRSC